METPEAWRPRVRRDQPLIARLRLATTRLADAHRERIWAIAAAVVLQLLREGALHHGIGEILVRNLADFRP